jgi:hypothetical protein
MRPQLLDCVRLRQNRDDCGVRAGTLGAVVDVHGEDSFAVEFVDGHGRHLALVECRSSELQRDDPSMNGTHVS